MAWLQYANQRFLMALHGIDYISEAGLSAALMAWKGKKVNWAHVVFEQMKLELSRKRSRNPMTLCCGPYLSYMCQVDLGLRQLDTGLGQFDFVPHTLSSRPEETASASTANRKGKRKLVEENPRAAPTGQVDKSTRVGEPTPFAAATLSLLRSQVTPPRSSSVSNTPSSPTISRSDSGGSPEAVEGHSCPRDKTSSQCQGWRARGSKVEGGVGSQGRRIGQNAD